MGKKINMHTLEKLSPYQFLHFLEHTFNTRCLTGNIINVQSISTTAKEMSGLSSDLSQLISWYMHKKHIPCSNYRLQFNKNAYLTYYFTIFQDRFSGKCFYFGKLGSLNKYESDFHEIIKKQIYQDVINHYRIIPHEYEIYRYDTIPAGIYEEAMISTYIHEFGERESLYMNDDLDIQKFLSKTNYDTFSNI